MRRRHALLISLLVGAAVIAITVGIVRAAGVNGEPTGAAALSPLGTDTARSVTAELLPPPGPAGGIDDDRYDDDRDDDDDDRYDDDLHDDDDHDDDDDHGDDD